MPPKAKTSKKPELPSEKELLSKAEAELLALRRLLELKNHEALEARRLERSWRERAELAEAALEQARVDIADIKADILRQHNTTQDHLASQVQQLASHQSSLSSQLEATASANQQLTAQVAQLRQEKQSQVTAHQQQLEALQLQFARMLKDTLDKMHARLEQQHSKTMTSTENGN